MILSFTASFAKDLRRIRDQKILVKLQELMGELEAAESLDDLKNLRKISTANHHYRLRLGDYRLGLIAAGNTLTLVRFLHRKAIYRYFP